MSLYKEFSILFPYIQSVRKIKTYLTFDVSFPNTWKLPKKFVNEEKVMEQTTTIPNERLFSFVSEITEDDVEKVSGNIQNIIKYNLEREEKEKLFDSKVNELKMIFEKQNLNNLKSLHFDIKKPKIELVDNEEEIDTTGVVGTGD
jgi:DNA polymerase III gamma/tau subunit